MKVLDSVRPEFIPQFWPHVEQFIAAALRHSKGEIEAAHLKLWCVQGQNTLLVALDDGVPVGAVVCHFENMPNDRIMFISAIGGKTCQEHFEQMFAWAKAQGATSVRGLARESVSRLWRMKFGFSEIYRVVEKKLC